MSQEPSQLIAVRIALDKTATRLFSRHSATAPLFLRLLQPTGNKGSRLHRLFRQLSHDALQGQLEDALNNL